MGDHFVILLSLLTLLLGLAFFVGSKILSLIHSRRDILDQKISDSERILEESKLMLSDCNSDLNRAREKANEIISKAKDDAHHIIHTSDIALKKQFDERSNKVKQDIDSMISRTIKDFDSKIIDKVFNLVRSHLSSNKGRLPTESSVIDAVNKSVRFTEASDKDDKNNYRKH